MSVAEKRTHQLLMTATTFEVPIFQRSYDWREEQFERLWGDLSNLRELVRARVTAKSFMGCLVGWLDPDQKTWLMIDGQQRLTTIYILLIALRDAAEKLIKAQKSSEVKVLDLVSFNESDDETSVNEDSTYWEGYDIRLLLSYERKPKLTSKIGSDPNKCDRNDFRYLIKREPITNKTSLMLGCYNFFRDKLKDSRLPVLKEMSELVLQHLNFLEFTLDADDNPQEIFDRLNKGGLPITEGDAIRNLFFMSLPKSDHELCDRQWKHIDSLLKTPSSKDHITNFCHSFIMMATKKYFKQERTFWEWRKYLQELNQDQKIQLLDEMTEASRFYASFFSTGIVPNLDPAITSALKKLVSLQITVFYPLIIWYYLNLKRDVTSEDFLEFLAILENFTMRAGLCKNRTAAFVQAVPGLCRKHSIKEVCKLLASSDTYPTDIDVRRALDKNNLYENKSKKYALAVLKHLESLVDLPTFQDVTIEHISPQKGMHTKLLHTIGNLALIHGGQNSSNKDKPFLVKKSSYSESIYKYTRELSSLSEWDEKAIKLRAQTIAEKVLSFWPYLEQLSPTEVDYVQEENSFDMVEGLEDQTEVL